MVVVERANHFGEVVATLEPTKIDLNEPWNPPLSIREVLDHRNHREILQCCIVYSERILAERGLGRLWEDAVQDAIKKILQIQKTNESKFHSLVKFKSYFGKIVMNIALAACRREKASRNKEQEIAYVSTRIDFCGDNIATINEVWEELNRLFDAMQQNLKPAESAVLLLKAYSYLGDNPDMTKWKTQIARNPNTQRSDARRGRQVIYRWLDEGKFSRDLKPILKQLFEGKSQ